VTFVDRTLVCVDCGAPFVHSASDQEYYAQQGFVSDPKRCQRCRAARRAAREGGGASAASGGSRTARDYFAVICTRCGNQAQVPFKPRLDRPVYCSDCYRLVKPD
jgi:CxxC-x17-CxxC domain-containing protein